MKMSACRCENKFVIVSSHENLNDVQDMVVVVIPLLNDERDSLSRTSKGANSFNVSFPPVFNYLRFVQNNSVRPYHLKSLPCIYLKLSPPSTTQQFLALFHRLSTSMNN